MNIIRNTLFSSLANCKENVSVGGKLCQIKLDTVLYTYTKTEEGDESVLVKLFLSLFNPFEIGICHGNDYTISNIHI